MSLQIGGARTSDTLSPRPRRGEGLVAKLPIKFSLVSTKSLLEKVDHRETRGEIGPFFGDMLTVVMARCLLMMTKGEESQARTSATSNWSMNRSICDDTSISE